MSEQINVDVAGSTALVVVDAQVGVLRNVWESGRVVENIRQLVVRARASGKTVVWVQHSDEELQVGSDDWRIAPELVPNTSEPVVRKRFNSAFAHTNLDDLLHESSVKRIVLAGAATNWCIRATAYAALERGYHVTIVGDAHSTENLDLGDGTVIPAQSIIVEFNTVMQWLQVPDVHLEVVQAADIAFT